MSELLINKDTSVYIAGQINDLSYIWRLMEYKIEKRNSFNDAEKVSERGIFLLNEINVLQNKYCSYQLRYTAK